MIYIYFYCIVVEEEVVMKWRRMEVGKMIFGVFELKKRIVF